MSKRASVISCYTDARVASGAQDNIRHLFARRAGDSKT